MINSEKLRVSSFCIWEPINPTQKSDYTLLYFTAAPLLPTLPNSIASTLKASDFSAIPPSYLKFLYQKGIITQKTHEEEFKSVLSMMSNMHLDQTKRTFTIIPTAACNLNCIYCPQENNATFMNNETWETIKSRIIYASSFQSLRKLEFRWYGGEPLMGYQKIISFYTWLNAKIANKNIQHVSMMATNGTLLSLSRLEKLYNEAHMHLISLTLDGNQKSHDITRPARSKRSNYQQIIKNISSISAQYEDFPSLRFIIRVNVSTISAPHILDLIKELRNQNINNPMFEMQFIPVYNWAKDNSNIIIDEGLDDIIFNAIEECEKQGISTPFSLIG